MARVRIYFLWRSVLRRRQSVSRGRKEMRAIIERGDRWNMGRRCRVRRMNNVWLRGAFQSREALQDSMLSLREAMDLILHKEEKGKGWRVEDVSDLENAYMGENRLSSVNSAEQEAFTRGVFKPMLGAVAKLAETEEERMVLTDYLMVKHGLERNRVMAEREGLKAYETYMKKHPESERRWASSWRRPGGATMRA